MADFTIGPFLREDIRRWQHFLHTIPELGFQEKETTAWLQDILSSLPGVTVERPTPTGLVATLAGGKPGKLVAYRTDIDALPITEDSNHQICSQRPGAMHACGHDGHMAMALGAITCLSEHREELAGSVRFIFQHAEEVPPGGAIEMVNAGVLDGVSAIVGCHLESKGKSGKVYVVHGPMLAATYTFSIEIIGKGGHAASPHMTVDPVLVGSNVVMALQSVISRRRDPLHRLVLSVTKFHAGTADNIIPQSAELAGTVRILDEGPGYNELVPQWMLEVIAGVTAAYGATYKFHFARDYDMLSNNSHIADLVERAAANAVGVENVLPGDCNMAGDDMGTYLREVPGCYYVVGCQAVTDGVVYPNHHPGFLISPDSLGVGAQVAVNSLLELLADETL